jgi:hypothetical protein
MALIIVAPQAAASGLLVATDQIDVVERQLACLAFLACPLAIGIGQYIVRHGEEPLRFRHVVELTLTVVLIGAWILNRGMIQIGAFDHSIVINSGWLQVLGRKPGVDFPYTLPPLFFLGAGLAMRWFGVHWQANIIVTAAYAILNDIWCYALLRALRLPHYASLMLSLGIAGMTLMLTCYWWYNPLAGLATIVLLLTALAWLRRPDSLLLPASFWLAFSLVLLNKPNGWPAAFAVVAMLMLSGPHRLRTALFVVMAGVTSAALIQYKVIDVTTLLQTYRMLSKTRGIDPERLQMVLHPGRREAYLEVVKLYCLVALFASLWLAPRLHSGFAGRVRSWCSKENVGWAGALATGIIFFLTNTEMKAIDLALPAAAAGVWACCYAREVLTGLSGKAKKIGSVIAVGGIWIMVVASLQGLLDGWVRERVRFIWPDFYFEIPLCDRHPGTNLFAGVRTGCTFVRTVDQLADFVREHPKEPIFFGMHLEFAYSAFGRSPPEGFPIWWHFGTSYFESDVSRIWQAFKNKQFAWLIFPNDVYEELHYKLPILQTYQVYRKTPELIFMQPRAADRPPYSQP